MATPFTKSSSGVFRWRGIGCQRHCCTISSTESLGFSFYIRGLVPEPHWGRTYYYFRIIIIRDWNLHPALVGLIFGLATVFGSLLLASKIDPNMSNNTIVLTGMVFSLFINALLQALTALFRENLESIVLWQWAPSH